MQYITTFENIKMPKLIYGTAWKKERTADLVVQAILSGFRGIDTACQPKHYDEALVGEALERLVQEGIGREELFVQTKFTPLAGQDPSRIPYDPNAPLEVQVAQSFEASKRNLRTKYVDSLVLHSPLFPYTNLL
ncbi:MAG TPA: aldo/keto reductase, partial [Sulfuricurvum sp.]|nr:aldo/keto reductase [Sulfuricurvum sp.]